MSSKLTDTQLSFAASYFKDVVAFQEKFGLVVDKLEPADFLLRHQLMTEEYAEMVLAFRSGDLPEFADALGDLRYVVCGTAALLGIVIPDSDYGISYKEKPSLLDERNFLYYQGRLMRSLSDAAIRYAWMTQTGGDTSGIAAALVHADESVSVLARLSYIPMGKVHAAIHAANMGKVRASSTDNKRKSAFDVIKPPGWKPPDIRAILVDSGWLGERGVGE